MSTVQRCLWESCVPHTCPLRAWLIFFQRAKPHASAYGWLVAKQKSRISRGGGTATAFPSWILWEKTERQSRHHLSTLPEQIQCLELQQLNRTETFSNWALMTLELGWQRPWSHMASGTDSISHLFPCLPTPVSAWAHPGSEILHSDRRAASPFSAPGCSSLVTTGRLSQLPVELN